MAENIIARNPIIGRVADLDIEKSDAPHAYKNKDITSKTTNIRI
jgi:hypothetical protein